MADDPSKQTAAATSAAAEGSRRPERRIFRRYPFVAAAEVTELCSGARLPGRMSDLGMQGCYIQTVNPFPVGTLVRVRLLNGKETFESTGRVCYSYPGLGMGLAFPGLKFDQLVMLEGWLAELGTQLGPPTL